MKRLLVRLFVLLFVVGIVAPGCTAGRVISGTSLPATMSTEGKLAVQGRAVLAASEGILTATEAAVNAKVLTPQQALPVAQATRQIGLMGERLAAALRVLDAITSAREARDAAAKDAAAILADMSGAVTALPDTTRAALSSPVGTFMKAVAAVRALLPA